MVVIDDGLDSSHPDLAPNFSAEISHDFNGEDEDVSPRWRLGAQLLCDIAIDTNNIIVPVKSCVMCCLLYFVCVCQGLGQQPRHAVRGGDRDGGQQPSVRGEQQQQQGAGRWLLVLQKVPSERS